MYQYSSQYKGKIRIFTLLLGIILIALICVLFFYHNLKKNYSTSVTTPFDKNDTNLHLFQIEKNENVKSIAKRLKDESIIADDLYFWWYLRSNQIIPNIQAGTHYVAKSYNYAEIAKELSKARPKEKNLTIPEGYRIDQIDAKLTEEGLIDEGRFVQAVESFKINEYDFLSQNGLEGYLFPDTYRVFDNYYNFQSKGLIIKMINNFENKINDIYDPAKTDKTLEEIVIMASIIEKETNNKDNRALVAGILWKRLEIGMPIGADATTRYGIGKFTEELTYDNLQSDSPYNTRKFKGLPPGPICNPGLPSLKAAINPEESEYLYYLHDANGEIHYGKTNEEHNANKAKYL